MRNSKKEMNKVGNSSVKISPEKSPARRRAIKTFALGGGVIALPAEWKKPIVRSILLPAHGQTSETTPPPRPVPITTCAPSSLDFTLERDTPFLVSADQEVEFTMVVTNSGPGIVESFSIMESTGQLAAQTGGPLNPGQSVTLTESRTFTFSAGDTISIELELTGTDDCGNQFEQTQTVEIFTIGINMAIYTSHQSVRPGDEIRVKLVSRLHVSELDDVQLTDMKYRCNLLSNRWCHGGPDDSFWADPSSDFINQREGARKLALDIDEGNDHGAQPDWIHEFTYKVPNNQAKDLIITAEDKGSLRVYFDGRWSSNTPISNGFDKIILPLI